MKALALFAALMVAGPASAVPPVLPAPAARALVQAFVRATESNDLSAYAKLFAPDATVTTETGATLDKTQWLKAVSAEFVPYRRTHFLNVFAGDALVAGKPATRVVFVEQAQRSRPNAIEQFSHYQSEVITVEDGQIVHLETSGYLTHRLTAGDDWTFF
jgi:hypothetical protein